MRAWALALCVCFLVACGQVESTAQENMESANKEAQVEKKQSNKDTQKYGCTGVFKQGGLIVCNFPDALEYSIGGMKVNSRDGVAYIGFDRDAPKLQTLTIKLAGGAQMDLSIEITPREYTISRIDGLPPSQVSNYSKKQLARIRSSSARKKKGFASREQTMWFKDGFTYPLKSFVKTSPFGAQRILNGIKKKPHYGVDIAAPVGTPIYAPADGVVSLADDDLYFEGAMVLLDHGQGLISMYLHMDAIDVKPGQMVKRGEKLGEVGSKGRSTGPHLCWRLKWRNRHLDPELLTEWPND